MRSALVLVLTLASVPATAHAYEEQVGLALGGGYAAVASDNPLPHHGFLLQLQASLGLGDTWELRALSGYALHLDSALLHRVPVGSEIVYLIDVLEVVPFLGIGVDAVISVHETSEVTSLWADFAGHGVVGLDWLVDREWALGLEARAFVLFTSIASAPADPVWVTVTLRAQYLIEVSL